MRFNPRTPCGVRLHVRRQWPVGQQVSIHALLAECDTSLYNHFQSIQTFQSTHSLRSATKKPGQRIRAAPGFNPRTPCGVRQYVKIIPDQTSSFNPRTPCGVRHFFMRFLPSLFRRFQSTHSLRSATGDVGCGVEKGLLFQSTHSLRSATFFRHEQCDFL